jgi:uncharacterized protein (TIGR03118 family)
MKNVGAALLSCLALASVCNAQHFKQKNLVSDLPGLAATTDPNLINPWGLSRATGSPWWISDNNAGTSTLYDGKGAPVPLVVTIPSATSGTLGSPTGTMFNGTSGFELTPGNPAFFLFVTEDGTISGWNPSVNGTVAQVMVNQSPASVFKGATLAVNNGATFLYAADFRKGEVAVFDSSFNPVAKGPGAFKDTRVPAGFAPFNVQNIGGNLFVTYAKQNAAKHDPVGGAGFGFVTVFHADGTLAMRLEQGEWLNAPWGVALSPSDFGPFSHHILVGQFKSGTIAAYNAVSGRFEGQFRDTADKVLAIDGLWALSFGDSFTAGSPITLFFTAGIQDEAHGLFGTLKPVGSELVQGNGE